VARVRPAQYGYVGPAEGHKFGFLFDKALRAEIQLRVSVLQSCLRRSPVISSVSLTLVCCILWWSHLKARQSDFRGQAIWVAPIAIASRRSCNQRVGFCKSFRYVVRCQTPGPAGSASIAVSRQNSKATRRALHQEGDTAKRNFGLRRSGSPSLMRSQMTIPV